MRRTTISKLLGTAALAWLSISGLAQAQVIGSYDNFDCFNDTGETAEGFEIDVQDIQISDLTREFPSNFSTTPWVIRYGLPTVTAYDYTTMAPDPEHAYDAGHKGVLITWAASWDGTQWVAQFGNQPFGNSVAGNGTPYVANPSYTNGDSCWYYGLGDAYPTSGCDHFGISLSPGSVPGLMSYHWKIPNPNSPGTLINAGLEASLPPSPVLTAPPPVPGAPPEVQAEAEAPEVNQDPNVDPAKQFGDAYWVKITTFFSGKQAQLDQLQKVNVAKFPGKKTVSWGLLQRPPVGKKGEKLEIENEVFPKGAVSVTKQYEYFKFKGAYGTDSHEAFCGVVALGISKDCTQPYTKTYTVVDPETGLTITAAGGDRGSYLGAHVNAYNIK
ncbi:MAG: hypothetical protein U0Q18_07780 [Bryobacteraceae bacterium]